MAGIMSAGTTRGGTRQPPEALHVELGENLVTIGRFGFAGNNIVERHARPDVAFEDLAQSVGGRVN